MADRIKEPEIKVSDTRPGSAVITLPSGDQYTVYPNRDGGITVSTGNAFGIHLAPIGIGVVSIVKAQHKRMI